MKKKGLTIFDAGIAFLLSFVLAQLTGAFGIAIIKSIMSSCGKSANEIKAFFDTASGYLVQSICMNIAFVLVFVWHIRRVNKSEVLAKPDKNTWKYVAICVVIGLATMFLLSGTLNYFQLLVDKLGLESPSVGFELNSVSSYLISLLALAVIPAVCEEMIFRGVLVNALKHKGKVFAVVISSIMFSIFHFSPTQLIYPVCFGLILSIVYLRTNNILFPMLLHFINNALSLSIQYFSNGSGGEFVHSISTLIFALITLAGWIVIMIYMFKEFNHHNKKAADSQNVSALPQSADNNTQTSATTQFDNWILYGSMALMLGLYIILI